MQIANEYLEHAKELICKEVFYNDSLASKCHVSYGWPSSKGLSAKNRTIGQAWQQGGKEAIFISPVLFKHGNDIQVLETLVHELIHIDIGVAKGHRGGFKKAMNEVGLTGKATATIAGEELRERLNDLKSFHDLQDLPELKLDKSLTKKQGTRLILIECDCGRKLRLSRKVLDEGSIQCNSCDSLFKEQA